MSDDPKVIKEYTALSIEYKDYSYFYTSSALGRKFFPKIKSEPTVVVLNNFGEDERYYVPAFTREDFEDFLIKNENPLVITDFNQQIVNDIFATPVAPKVGIVMFRDMISKSTDAIDRAFSAAARRLKKDSYTFAITDIAEEGFPKRIAFFLSITTKDLPSLQIIHMDGDLKRYVYKGPMDEEGIYNFVKDYEAGKAKRFFRSAPVPKKNDGPVYEVVGTTFKKEVIDGEKEVLVNFYAPWDEASQKFSKVYDSLAKKLRFNKYLKLVKIDQTNNDVEGHTIGKFPALKLYAGKDTKAFIEYTGKLNEKDIIAFVQKNCAYPVEATE